MERIDCPLCNLDNDTIAIRENDFNARQCSSCGMIYVSPRPKLAELLKYYAHTETSVNAHIEASSSKSVHSKHTLSILRTFKENGSILELGAGGGYFLKEARKKGYEVFAIEPNQVKAKFISKMLRIPCETQPFSAYSFNRRSFDIIYHCDVLSHLYHPVDDLKLIHARLNHGGFLIFETGNTADVNPKYYRYFSEFGLPGHLHFFGKISLQQLMSIAGFEIIFFESYSKLAYLIFLKSMKRLVAMTPKQPGFKSMPIGYHHTEDYALRPPKFLPNIAKETGRFILFFLKYKLGKHIRNPVHPRTFIIVAQKKQI